MIWPRPLTDRQLLLVVGWMIVLGMLVGVRLANAQTRYGYFIGAAHDTLKAAVRRENEAAYCVLQPVFRKLDGDSQLLFFDTLHGPVEVGATPSAIHRLRPCPRETFGLVHTHPGSSDGYCEFSATDLKLFQKYPKFEAIAVVCLPPSDNSQMVRFAFREEKRSRSVWPMGFWVVFGSAMNGVTRLDTDDGTDADLWGAPDKQLHAVSGFALVSAASNARIPVWKALVVTCAGAGLWELSQGAVSAKDIVAGCGGAGLAALYVKVAR